ncbi:MULTISPECIES: carbohydrate ABC transporter permease [Hungatella]|uniref:ABC transporter permease subunit n=1 Tax=Hungatella hathewayi TaxID=154046 RepID=A0AAW9WQ17_9FIRM|nr:MULTISPECIES: carbohydrate ABC transporter permease [Hungatella]MCQ4832425.1 carbohydrate ABC transporter permease [Hungatella sp. SL.1.14]MUB66489.1 ABC transporter permease subunit [Hungatella hathewayi]CUQ45742.1 binding-protein-dependent transport system inner membrane protein [Hungatella hathewayi]
MKNNYAYYKKRLKPIPKYILVIVLSFIFFSPFLIMVTTALKTNADAFQLPVKLFPREVIWNNFPEAMAKIPYVRYMMNTIFITLLSVIGQMVATPLVAYSLAKIKWKGAPIISALIMGTMMIPYTVTMIPLYKIWSRLGFTNTYVPLILPTFFGSPFYIIIMRQFFAGLPNSLMEAAKIDGAGEFKRYIAIALPLSRPALTTVGIYAFINAWSDYLAPLIYINKTEKLTLSLGLQGFLNQYSVDWTHLMAAATIFVIPVVIFFLFFQRNFVEGIATSGIKG